MNSGHHKFGPPPKGGRVLDLSKDVVDKIAKETYHRVQPHLNELNQENAAHQAAISLVFSAAIQKHGVPEVNGELYDACMELASKLARQNLRTTHEKARDLFIEMKLAFVPEHIRRAALKQGVIMPCEADFAES